MITCGLDASTTTAGYAFTDEAKKILVAGYVDLKQFDTNRAKATAILAAIHEKCPADVGSLKAINLEGSLSGFSGPSSRTVVVKLARFSAVLEYALQDAFTCPVNLVGATTARKQLFGKGRIKGVKPKDFVRQAIDQIYDTKQLITRNRAGNEDKRVGDVLDAVVMAAYRR